MEYKLFSILYVMISRGCCSCFGGILQALVLDMCAAYNACSSSGAAGAVLVNIIMYLLVRQHMVACCQHVRPKKIVLKSLIKGNLQNRGQIPGKSSENFTRAGSEPLAIIAEHGAFRANGRF